MIGTTLSHYRITAALGAGGMGEVWRAEDTKLGRQVALKVLPQEFVGDPQRLERFDREARAVAALNHPSIVTIYSVEEDGGVRFLTMELIEGRCLDQLIPGGGLHLDRFLNLATPLAEAMSAAHEKGVVHRDLKPSNVMVDGDGRVKILDFGLAKLQENDDVSDSTSLPTEALTGVGIVVGTVPYMSPEQVEGLPVDHRTDIFSLGILLYEMATGVRPFQGSSTAGLMSAILKDVPKPIGEIRADLPRHLGRVIGRCLEKERRDRYQTARDVFNELKFLRRESDSAAGTSSSHDFVAAATEKGLRTPASYSGTKQAQPSLRIDGSGPTDIDEGFWIAVLPFKVQGTDSAVEALADGISEDIVTGLSRFSYLRVISRSSTSCFANETLDVRTVGRELGARYVMEGSIRQEGPVLRVAVQVVDSESGAHLWAETYNRPFSPGEIFELQDDLAPRIVSTIADMNGILPHSMSEAIRSRPVDQLSPYEAMLRGFGYYVRLTAEDHAEARACLEKAVADDPGNADCWALLSVMYAEEHKHGFNVKPYPLDRSLEAARRAVAVAPLNHFAHHSLAQALFFRRELQAFRIAADRAVALNPMDGCTTAFMGILMAYAGQWAEGCALAEKAMELNPHHPGWYRFSIFLNAYRMGNYQAALDIALMVNMPSYFFTHAALASAYGKLGDQPGARHAVSELLEKKPDFASTAREEWERWIGPGELLEDLLDGLRKAGLRVDGIGGQSEDPGPSDVASPVKEFRSVGVGARSITSQHNNLPLYATPFVGRRRELLELTDLLRREEVRLVTLAGPAGIGKTRLSLQVAAGISDDFAHGVFFVDLAGVSDPERLPSTIAGVLNVAETAGEEMMETLENHLQEKKMLLVLDNFEQIVEAAQVVGDLVRAAPHLKAVVTSRELLHLSGEYNYAVPPLALPDLKRIPAVEDISQFEAVDLFLQRARTVRPEFEINNDTAPLVAEICVRLDGLPLAIELAAARVSIFSAQQLLERLENRLKTVSSRVRDLPDRQRTLRGAIDWSYDLLDDDEKILFARLAVFQGGRTLEAAEAVCEGRAEGISLLQIDAAEGLESLVDKSLLRRIGGRSGEPRFEMLETIHEYARERLAERDESERLSRLHAEYFAGFAEEAEPVVNTSEFATWKPRLEDEAENILLALGRSLAGDGIASGIRLLSAICSYWYTAGKYSLHQEWVSRALERVDEIPTRLRARFLLVAGHDAFFRHERKRGSVFLQEALKIALAGGDQQLVARAYIYLMTTAMGVKDSGMYELSKVWLDKVVVISDELQDTTKKAQALNNMGEIARSNGDYVTARRVYEESLQLYREIGNKLRESLVLGNLGQVSEYDEDYEAAKDYARQALTLAVEIDNLWLIGDMMRAVAPSFGLSGQPWKASRLYGAHDAIAESIGSRIQPGDLAQYECGLTAVKALMDDEEFEKLWAEGREMSLDEAVAYVFADDEMGLNPGQAGP